MAGGVIAAFSAMKTFGIHFEYIDLLIAYSDVCISAIIRLHALALRKRALHKQRTMNHHEQCFGHRIAHTHTHTAQHMVSVIGSRTR